MPDADVVEGTVVSSDDSFPLSVFRDALESGAVLVVPQDRAEQLWRLVDVEPPENGVVEAFTIDEKPAAQAGATLGPVGEGGRFTLDVEPGPAVLCYYGGVQPEGPPYTMTKCIPVELEVPGRILLRSGQDLSVKHG